MVKFFAITIGLLSLALTTPGQAYEPGEWLVRVGAHNISPKSDNHSVVNVDDAIGLTFNLTYMFRNNWGLELLAAAPFNHDIHLNSDGSKVGETDHLPPTFSLQYHFLPDQKFQPFVGAGINWTLFFEESTEGALAGTQLKLDDSVGLAFQLGFDYRVNDNWFVNAEARYIDIETDASLDGADIGIVEIDPWLFGIAAGFTF